MKFKVNEVSIGEALKCIESHVYSLPSIQRPFQWSKEKIQNLITSVIEGYPLNMMTFMHFNYDETSPNQLAHSYSFIDRYVTRDYLPDPEWEGKGMHRAPKEDRAKEVKYWVFDGQQRLTSLNIAFRGSYAVCKKGGWGYIIKNYVPECLFVKLGNKNDKGRNDSNIDSESPLIYNWIDESQATGGGDRASLVSNGFLNLRTAYLAITAGLDIDKLVIEDTGLKNIYKSLYNSIRGEGEQANNLMVLFLSAGSIEQGFQTFLRINNSGEPVSKADLCLASISCHWPDARSHFERLEKVLIPSEQDPFYRELGAADVYRQIILQASLIAATSGDPKVEVEIEHFDPVVSVKIKENKDLISEALIKSRNLINYLKISNTNRGLRQVVFYLFYKFEDQVKAENAGPFIRSLHIGWFNNQTTEAAKLGRCIRLMQISHTVEDALRSVINEIGTLTLDEVSSLEFGKRPTTKLLQILKAAEGHYNPMDRYAVDHLHPTARTNEYLNSLPERERAIFEHERNKLPNLQLLDVRINSGTKSGKHLAVWLADHPDQRAILLPFPHTDDQLQLDKAYEFWNLRRIDLEKQIKKLFYLKPHEPGQEVFELPGSPV